MALYLSIPCRYEKDLLTVKALKLSGAGDTKELALAAAIKSTALYTSLYKGKFEVTTDKHNNEHTALIVLFSDILLKELNKIEPYPEDKPRYKGLLTPPSQEETLKYGF